METKHKPAKAEITQGSVEGAIYVRLSDQGGYAAEFYGHNAQRNAKRLINYPRLVEALQGIDRICRKGRPGKDQTGLIGERVAALLRALGELE